MYKFSALILLLFITVFTAFAQSTGDIPSPRNQPAIAFDSKRGKLVLFGGIDQAGTSLNDTWEWDGAKWIKRVSTSSPPARAAHAIAYDVVRGRTVLFGGQTGPNALADTWEWDGNTWTRIEPKTAPPPARVAHALVYDQKRKKIILFGGTDFATKQTFNDTWEWDGQNWIEVKTTTVPEGRFHGTLAFDSKRNRVVLFGGNSAIPPLNSAKFKAGQRNDT
jgi:N-acetylneuraminic acid mutarotase